MCEALINDGDSEVVIALKRLLQKYVAFHKTKDGWYEGYDRYDPYVTIKYSCVYNCRRPYYRGICYCENTPENFSKTTHRMEISAQTDIFHHYIFDVKETDNPCDIEELHLTPRYLRGDSLNSIYMLSNSNESEFKGYWIFIKFGGGGGNVPRYYIYRSEMNHLEYITKRVELCHPDEEPIIDGKLVKSARKIKE